MRMIRLALSPLLIATATRAAAAQCPDGSPPPCRGAAVAARPANTIAVLYFDNLSRDTGDVYLADGFSEEIMSRLGQVERLQVKSRTAVQRLRGRRAADPSALGRSLAVAHLVSGSVMRARGRLRVTVELTRVAGGTSVWTRSFERPADDIIAVEAEIAESIAANVGARLAPAERRRIESRGTRNAAAYDHLLRGRFEQSRRTTAAILRALREYDAALALDSTFMEAIVGKSLVLTQLGGSYFATSLGMPRDSFLARGRRLAERAIRMDSMSGDAWLAMASSRRSVSDVARAVALDPRSAEIRHMYGLALRTIRSDSAAIAEFHRALALDADRPITLVNLGQLLLIRRRYDDAQRWIDSAISLRPEPSFYYADQGLLRFLRGDTAGTRASAEAVAARGDRDGADELLAILDARAGDTASAIRRLARADSSVARSDCYASHACLQFAMVLSLIGQRERAVAVMERITPRGAWLALWSQRPELDGIRTEPRFQRLVSEARAAAAYTP